MRICILMTEEDPVLNEACEAAKTPPGCYLPEHEWKVVELNPDPTSPNYSVERVRKLWNEGWDVYLNLCDGITGEGTAGIEVVHELERLGAAYTGADSGFFEPTRQEQKRVCEEVGVRTPGCAFVLADDDLAAATAHMRYPFIVKRANGYASIGMDAKSKVHDLAELQAKVAQLAKDFPEDAHQPGAAAALVEEFIDGREFTVLVAEPLGRGGVLARPGRKHMPRAWHPIECRFPKGETFKHYDLKWVTFEGLEWVPVDDDVLAQRLIEATRRLFTGLRGTGYARCDLRMDAEGHIYMLEINPNPGIFYPEVEYGSADFILVNDGGHAAFLDHVFQLAFARQAALQKQIAMRKAMAVRSSLARRRRLQVVKQA